MLMLTNSNSHDTIQYNTIRIKIKINNFYYTHNLN